jgi:hypothetical protein
VDYVVHLVGHKLTTTRQSAAELFSQLKTREVDRLTEQEFVEGLQQKFGLWVAAEELELTYRALKTVSAELSREDFEAAFSLERFNEASLKQEYFTTKCKFLTALAAAYTTQLHLDTTHIRSQFRSIAGGKDFLSKDSYLTWVRQNSPDLSEEDIENYWSQMIQLSSDPARGVSSDAFGRTVIRYGIGNYGKGRFVSRGSGGSSEAYRTEEHKTTTVEGDDEYSQSSSSSSRTVRRTERTEVIEEGEGSSEEEEEVRKVTTSRRRSRRVRRG